MSNIDINNNLQEETISDTSISSNKRLSLLDFNLEPLTDTLESLDLSDNGLTGLPMQFESRSFARLRDLDLSHNPINGMNKNDVNNFSQK